jgi:hypothetical protein
VCCCKALASGKPEECTTCGALVVGVAAPQAPAPAPIAQPEEVPATDAELMQLVKRLQTRYGLSFLGGEKRLLHFARDWVFLTTPEGPAPIAPQQAPTPAPIAQPPKFNPEAKCDPFVTQCPRCNNPHHACDKSIADYIGARQAQAVAPIAQPAQDPPLPPHSHSLNSGSFAPLYTADQMRAYRAAAPQQAPQMDNFCWLVEEFGPEGKSTGRYMLDQGALTITHDVNAARKFRRWQSAGFRALDMKAQHKGDWRAVEHGFAAPQAPAVAPHPPMTQGAALIAQPVTEAFCNMVADSVRLRWLTEDHADPATRARCRELLKGMPVMSYSAATADIDAAMRECGIGGGK